MTARFLALYETPPDPGAFDRHYHQAHIPLIRCLPGLRRWTRKLTAPVPWQRPGLAGTTAATESSPYGRGCSGAGRSRSPPGVSR